MRRPPFAAYQGTQPYIFVCYSHRDSETVFSELTWLRDEGFHLWYDEGIAPGSEWNEAIATAIESSAVFLYFISPRAIASEHCRRELNFALECDRKIVAIHLEHTELSGGLRLSLGHRQAILKHNLSDASYRQRLPEAIRRFIEGGERPQVPLKRAPPLAEDRVHIAVSSPSGTTNRAGEELVAAVVRYLSWQGGVYRVHTLGSSQLVNLLDYRIDLAVADEGDHAFGTSWQVYRAESGEVVWTGHASEPTTEYRMRRHAHIAETIGEGALRAITGHELRRISEHDVTQLGYGRLLLLAEQPNFLDRELVAQRSDVLNRAIELQPKAGFAYASLCSLLSWQLLNAASDEATSDQSRVWDAARLALKFEPNDPFVLLNVGITYCRLGRYDQGLSLIRRSCDMAPTLRAKETLALCLSFAGNPDDAVPLYEEIQETMPAGHTFPYVRFAVVLSQLGRLDDALRYSHEGVVHFSQDYFSWLVHGNLLAQLGKEDRAREAIDEAIRLLPNLRLETAIKKIENTFGRTEAQRAWLTLGLRRLSQPSS